MDDELFHSLFILLSLVSTVSCLRSIRSSEISVELVDKRLDECQTAVDEVCFNNILQKRVCVNRCKRECLLSDLKNLERYDWVNRKVPDEMGQLWLSYASIRRCVTKTLMLAGSYGLVMGTPPYNARDCRVNTGSKYNIISFYFPHGDPIRYSRYNGTISFRMKLFKKNIVQTRQTCAPLTVYLYSEPHDLELYLRCSTNGNNMDLRVRYTNNRTNDRIVMPAVLNDDEELTVENSIHIAHTIDTENRFSILYVNGKPAYSMTAESPSYYLRDQIYNSAGLNSILYDFYVYDDVLNEQQVRSLYLNSTFTVQPEPECACPPTHPLLVRDNDGDIKQAVRCSAPVNYILTDGDISEKISSAAQIHRIGTIQTQYPVTNILRSGRKWISANTDEIELLIVFSNRYQAAEVELNIDTLPETVEIRTAGRKLMRVNNSTCDPIALKYYRWNDEQVNLVRNRLILNFSQIPTHFLFTDRIYVKFEGHNDQRQHPFVINDIYVKYQDR